jgi:TonB family protein
LRYKFIFITIFLFTWLPAICQQDAQAFRPAGAGHTAPVLLTPSLTVSAQKHCDEHDGIVKLAAIIDEADLPRELKTLDASDLRLVGFATKLVEAQRFKPGTVDGSTTAVAVELTVGLHTCAQHQKHPADGDFYLFTLRAHPLIALTVVVPSASQEVIASQRNETATNELVGGRISAPIPTFLTDPKIPISGKLPKRGLCLLGVTINANGVPQDIHIVRSLDPELDSYVIESVKNWRFKPALRDGSDPVAVEGTVAATFENVDKEPVAFATFIQETPEKIQAAIARHQTKQPDLEPINADEVIARYMPPSRVTGRCFVSLVIDTNGVPQNVHVIKGLDSSLDMETVAMVEHFRFKPVMKDGTTPIPVGLIVPVHYRKMLEKPTWNDLFSEGLGLAIFSLL